jgi:hypothetical protein
MNDNNKAVCPVCETEFSIAEKYDEGDILNCPKCEIKLEIESLFPPDVREAEYDDSELEEEEEIVSEVEEEPEELDEAVGIVKDREESKDDYKQDDI